MCVAKCAHPLDVELHVLLRATLDLLLHFPYGRLHIDDALLVDAADGERDERKRASTDCAQVNTYQHGKVVAVTVIFPFSRKPVQVQG